MKRPGQGDGLGKKTIFEVGGLSHQGEGVARMDGIAVFIPGALPGETVCVRLVSKKQSFFRAELLEIIKPSAFRRVPRCSLARACGGCSLQHLDYSEQLRWKREMVQEALKRIGQLSMVPVKPVLGMSEPWRYRNRVQLHLQVESDYPELRLGYFLPGSREVLELEDCLLMPASWSQLLKSLRLELSELWLRIRAKGGEFPLHHLLMRFSRCSGETGLLLVVKNASELLWRQWVEGFLKRLPSGVTQVAENVNLHPEKTNLGERTRILYGRPWILEEVEGVKFRLSPASFFQINLEQTAVLCRQVQEYAGLSGSEEVLDFYCGVGTIALFLARLAGRVTGIEALPEAVADARGNARLNGIKNAAFECAEVEKYLERCLNKKSPPPELVILDPPRRGVKPEALQLLARLKPQRIIYVSCNPATLARDLRHLKDNGFTVVEVQPLDMFPQTSHVECVVLMTNVKNK